MDNLPDCAQARDTDASGKKTSDPFAAVDVERDGAEAFARAESQPIQDNTVERECSGTNF